MGKQPPSCSSRPGPVPGVLVTLVPDSVHIATLQPRPGRPVGLTVCPQISRSIPGAAGSAGAKHLGCGFEGKLSRQSVDSCVSSRSFWRDGLGMAPYSLCSLLGRALGLPVTGGCQVGPGQMRSVSSIRDGDHRWSEGLGLTRWGDSWWGGCWVGRPLGGYLYPQEGRELWLCQQATGGVSLRDV